MNLVKFIDCRFQELRLKEQEETKKNAYSITRDSEVLALQSLLKFTRTFTKWLMVPKVIFNYMTVICGFTKEPEPVLLNKLKAEQEAQKVAKTMLDQLKEQKETQAEAIPTP